MCAVGILQVDQLVRNHELWVGKTFRQDNSPCGSDLFEYFFVVSPCLCVSLELSAFPLRSLRLCGQDCGAYIFEPQRHRENRDCTEKNSKQSPLSFSIV
jgi:hypothetical protein